jgi:uncharacterized protein (TIGR00369 family)
VADELDFVRRWIAASPYAQALGVELVELTAEGARLRLPYSDANANPGRALHGGNAASLGAIGGLAVARAAQGEAAGPWHTCALQVSYLAAAIGEDVFAEARLLRKGKELCFAEVDVRTPDGKSIAHATSAVRGRFGAAEAALAKSAGDHGRSEPGAMGPGVGKLPFVAGRGIRVEHMTGGTSRLVMPWKAENADAGGGTHEGAVLALLDTTGAMAAWAETGPGRYKASTPAIQAQLLCRPPEQDLVAYGRVAQRDGELFWADVEVATHDPAARIVARGTVVYRILV